MQEDNLHKSEVEIRNQLIYLCDRMFRHITIEELMIIKMFKPAVIAFMQKTLSVSTAESYERIEFEETMELCDAFLSETHPGLLGKLNFLRESLGGIQPDADHTMAYPFYSVIKLKSEHNFIDVANLMHENTHMVLEWQVYPRILQEVAPIVVETLALQFLLSQNKKVEQVKPMRAESINECNNYVHTVISLIEMCESVGINISENGLDNESREKLNKIPLPENTVAFCNGLINLEEVLTDKDLKNKKSLNLNHYLGTIIGVYLAEKVKTKEMDIDMIFSALTEYRVDYKQKLINLGITEDIMPVLISNLYKYTEYQLNNGEEFSVGTNSTSK